MMNITYDIDETPGHRGRMEDAHSIYNDDEHQFFAAEVYDGHGGSEAAARASRILTPSFMTDWIREFQRPASERVSATDILRNAYRVTDAYLIRENVPGGTTAANCYIIDEGFIAANAGDTRIVIGTRRNAFVLTTDHRPGLDSERERIEALGGEVVSYGVPRVQGILAVSRALGDAGMKPYVSAEPSITTGLLGKENDFIVVACDGVWDVLSPIEVIKLARENAGNGRPSDAIVRRALASGSRDNITVVVLDLREYVKNAHNRRMKILEVLG